MKKLFFFCLASCLGLWASAQKVYFLYLQSDDQSPFYVRIGDKIHSSAASGYLILPNLTDSNYSFGLGFAKSSNPESRFSVAINGGDKGYIIKNFDDGLGLFDFNDLSIVKAKAILQDNTVYETKSDKFSSILSKAASDPSILKVPVAKKEEPANAKPVEKEIITVKLEDSYPVEKITGDSAANQSRQQPEVQTIQSTAQISPPVNNDTMDARQEISQVKQELPTTVKEEKKSASSAEPLTQKVESLPIAAIYRLSTITRFSESSTTEGFGIIYFDKKENDVDTIRILIPSSKIKLVSPENATTGNEPVKEEKEESALVTKLSNPVTDTEIKQNEKGSNMATKSEKTETVNLSSCRSVASDKDFMRLRKRMAAKENEDSMLDEARKEFRGRCYNAEQVRYLSTLFLTSASKYQFFDAAYPYVTDKVNFASLSTEIRDEHYSKRFKALIGE